MIRWVAGEGEHAAASTDDYRGHERQEGARVDGRADHLHEEEDEGPLNSMRWEKLRVGEGKEGLRRGGDHMMFAVIFHLAISQQRRRRNTAPPWEE